MPHAAPPSSTGFATAGGVRRRELIVTSLGVAMTGLIVAVILGTQLSGSVPDRTWVESIAMLVMVSAFLACSTILLARRPDHSVSWLMALPILFMTLDLLAGAGPAEGGRVWLRWAADASWAVTFPTLIIFLPLVFPTGHPMSPTWRWVVPTGGAAVVGLTVGNAVSPDLLGAVENPAVVDGPIGPAVLTVGGVLFLVSGLAALMSAILRFRRATGVERLQLRWFVRGAALVPVAILAAGTLETSAYDYLRIPVFGAGMIVLPITVTAAILRYRLYDIDRIMSRVVTYTVVTILLLAVYVGIVLGVTELLSARSDPPDVVIAVATLVVAAVFRPVRERTQTLVDRRFNRTRHDNQRLLSRFAEQVRGGVAADDLTEQLTVAVNDALSPTHVSVWATPRLSRSGTRP